MVVEDPKDLERVDQELHIEELKRQINVVTGGEAANWQGDDCPPEIAEQFFENVLAYESTEETTMFRKLTEEGVLLPPAEKLTDQELSAKLWQIIRKMVELGHFLHATDHLNDRQLYVRLTTETFLQPFADMPVGAGTWHIDCTSTGSDEDTDAYLRAYLESQEQTGDYRTRIKADFDKAFPAPPGLE